MISSWEVYLFTRLDSVHGFFIAVGICAAIALVFPCVHYFTEEYWDEEDDHEGKKRTKRIIHLLTAAAVVFGAIASLVPTTKEAAVIYLLPKIANNEQVQKIPDNFAKVLNGKMEEWIADFEEKNRKK